MLGSAFRGISVLLSVKCARSKQTTHADMAINGTVEEESEVLDPVNEDVESLLANTGGEGRP